MKYNTCFSVIWKPYRNLLSISVSYVDGIELCIDCRNECVLEDFGFLKRISWIFYRKDSFSVGYADFKHRDLHRDLHRSCEISVKHHVIKCFRHPQFQKVLLLIIEGPYLRFTTVPVRISIQRWLSSYEFIRPNRLHSNVKLQLAHKN